MLAVVKAPPTHGTKKPVSFKIEGEQIPDFVLGMLKYMFPKCVKIYDAPVKKRHDKDEESVALESTDWYKKMSAEMTPGKAIRADRGLRGWTQNVLAQKLGISIQNLSAMEHDRRPVSKKMATKLSQVFGVPPETYFRF
ncbi:Helix-turn-helix [Fibrobacter sp. UWCM]|jgi:DNA-binding XRE family transcriptional regulator|nr:helix-turn-helix domain-containing protein [Fibrobacter sp.]MBR2059579.1 helix-turn-helix domain-containing protein [Fibrobacter sp.]MBR2306627.1 helix-turn-helix domain-containing protein [Fibrobacter sp.]MBR4006258.1 helix-turn-helix domain-containing protein [Fibrobacter sp.]SHH20704.1 Helix-turn-helix [Fibrobacter sp. UWCM]